MHGFRYFTADNEADLIDRWFGNGQVPGENATAVGDRATPAASGAHGGPNMFAVVEDRAPYFAEPPAM